MIKFFRKIRQGLLTENKFGKYLIYAIGEIVLIAIGILIALSLNNWNENRKVRIKEVTFLDKLTKEINEDIIRLNRNDSIVAIQVSQSKKALKLFHLAKTVKDIIRVDSLFSFQWDNLYINVSTYDEMINTGNFYTLKNKSLQKRIVNYYNSVKGDQIYIQLVNETSEGLRNSPNLNSFNYLINNYDKNSPLGRSPTKCEFEQRCQSQASEEHIGIRRDCRSLFTAVEQEGKSSAAGG